MAPPSVASVSTISAWDLYTHLQAAMTQHMHRHNNLCRSPARHCRRSPPALCSAQVVAMQEKPDKDLLQVCALAGVLQRHQVMHCSMHKTEGHA